tara:strand:- start:501 stop:920 length:420 start_codon:yes stop_codon:yes gene_type:complete
MKLKNKYDLISIIKLFSQYKFFFYILNLFLITLYLSPTTIVRFFFYNDLYFYSQNSPDFKVSVNHTFVFLIFSIVGFLTYKKINQLIILCIYLIFLSIILEFTHSLISYRGFELADMYGNLVGVTIAIIIIFFYKKKNF